MDGALTGNVNPTSGHTASGQGKAFCHLVLCVLVTLTCSGLLLTLGSGSDTRGEAQFWPSVRPLGSFLRSWVAGRAPPNSLYEMYEIQFPLKVE